MLNQFNNFNYKCYMFLKVKNLIELLGTIFWSFLFGMVNMRLFSVF